MSFSTKLNSFAHEIANFINAVLYLVRYSLFANTLHPAKRCSTVSFSWPHSLHLLHSASPLEVFHAFVSTGYSSIIITEEVFLGVKFFLSHKLQLSSCFRNTCFAFASPGILLSVSPQRLFLTLPLLLLSMLVSSLFQSFLHPVRYSLLQKFITVPAACIDVIALSLIELIPLVIVFPCSFNPFLLDFAI